MLPQDLDSMPYEDLKLHTSQCQQALKRRFYSSPITLSMLTDYKESVSPQKFSPYIEAQLKKAIGIKSSGGLYAKFDGVDEQGASYEIKYATHNDKRGSSFPQMIRLDREPDFYLLCIFSDTLKVYKVPGKAMLNSVIRQTATRAHANNPNELRINIKNPSPHLEFISGYRDLKIEARLDAYIFDNPR